MKTSLRVVQFWTGVFVIEIGTKDSFALYYKSLYKKYFVHNLVPILK